MEGGDSFDINNLNQSCKEQKSKYCSAREEEKGEGAQDEIRKMCEAAGLWRSGEKVEAGWVCAVKSDGPFLCFFCWEFLDSVRMRMGWLC